MYKDYKKYEVYDDGRIWSYASNKFLRPKTKINGYQEIGLVDNNGKQHWQCVHKIVYFAVNGLWEYPNGMQINHIDEDKSNNHISNLELVTPKQNINHGTRNARSAAAQSKRVGAFKNGELQMVFASTMEAQRNGFCGSHVSACCRGERKSHKGYEWRYLDGEEN